MGRKTQYQRVTEYYTSIQYGVCHGVVEKLIALKINDKIIGNCARLIGPVININRADLFGGIKKEGGVVGRLVWQDGSDTQLLDSYVAAKKGKTPTTLPGYRGIATAFFTEQAGASPKGFYWSANQPIIPPTHFRVTRLDRSWRPDIAAIPGDIDVADYAICIAFDRSLSMLEGGRLTAARNAVTALLNDLKSNDQSSTFDVRVVGWSSQIDAMERRNCSQADYDDLIAFTQGMFAVGGTVFTNAVAGLSEFYEGSGGKCRLFVFLTDGEPNDPADATLAGEILAETGADAYAFNLVLPNTTETQKMDNTPGDGVPVVSLVLAPLYLGNLFRSAVTQQIDSNPAHIIYECLTNPIWGLGLPVSMLDMAKFEAAAERLYEERFGLSMIWAQQDEIRVFIGEVLDHIQATFYADPRTGKICITLLRDDYDADSLEVLDQSNCTVKSFKRRTPAEITNEIVVTWTNPNTEEEEVVTQQSLGSIVANNGEIVSDNRNYYGVRRAALAAELCARDLAAATAPLATAEVEADRRFSRIVPGDVIKLNDPENGANFIIMRVLNVNYGRPGNSKILISMTEDIFSYDRPRPLVPPNSKNVQQSRVPTPPSPVEAMTLNYYMTVNSLDGAEDLADPDAQVAFFVSTDNGDTFDMEVLEETTLPTGSTSYESIGDYDIVGRVTLTADLLPAVTSQVTFAQPASGTSPAVADFALIGPDGIPEDDHEIALITAFDTATSLWTLRRGVLDTTPREWPAGTPVRFFGAGARLIDASVNAAGVPQNYKFRTRTTRGLLSEDRAPILDYTPTERYYAPARPANVTVAGASFGEVDARLLTSITVTWAHRNRLTEDVVLLEWDDATVTPEAGQTTTVRLINDLTGAIITEYTGLTGTSHTFASSVRGSADLVRVVVLAVRDGYESIQGHEVLLGFGPMPYASIGTGSWLNANDTASVFEDTELTTSASTDLDPVAVIVNQKGSF